MANKDKKFSSEKVIKICQKGTILFSFFTFISLFIYCLIFFTPFYDLSNCNAIWATGMKAAPLLEAYGIDITTLPEGVYSQAKLTKNINLNLAYFTRIAQASTSQFGGDSIQAFNKLLFTLSISGILISCLLFIYRSQLRKKYYITNYIVHAVVVTYLIVSASIMLNNLLFWEVQAKNVEYDIINAYYASQNLTKTINFSDISWVFTLGKVMFGIMIVASLLLIGLSVFKFIDNKDYEKQKAKVMKGE